MLHLIVLVFKILHVLRVAHFLVLKGSVLIVLELFLVLHKYHHVFPGLEHLDLVLLLALNEQVLEVSRKAV